MWRRDAQRGSATSQALPAELTLQWTRELPPAQPAWPDTQAKLQFDGVAEPVAAGNRLFVPSSRHDDVTALDTETGAILWRFT